MCYPITNISVSEIKWYTQPQISAGKCSQAGLKALSRQFGRRTGILGKNYLPYFLVIFNSQLQPAIEINVLLIETRSSMADISRVINMTRDWSTRSILYFHDETYPSIQSFYLHLYSSHQLIIDMWIWVVCLWKWATVVSSETNKEKSRAKKSNKVQRTAFRLLTITDINHGQQT